MLSVCPYFFESIRDGSGDAGFDTITNSCMHILLDCIYIYIYIVTVAVTMVYMLGITDGRLAVCFVGQNVSVFSMFSLCCVSVSFISVVVMLSAQKWTGERCEFK